MTYTTPTVNYSTTINGTYTTLTGVQSVVINRGRQRLQDPFPPSSCEIELIPANSYATPLAVGQFIDVRTTNNALSPAYFVGKITDVERVYDFPFNSGDNSAPGDRIRISATGGTGVLALNTLTAYSWPAQKAVQSAIDIGTQLNILVTNTLGPTPQGNASAQTYTGSAMGAVNELAVTGQFYIDDWDDARGGSGFGYGQPWVLVVVGGQGTPFTFRDTAGSGYKYNSIQYLSSVQSSFTQVQVNPEGLASQVASSGSAPYNTLVQSSYNANTAEASSLAGYLLNLNQQSTPVPFVVQSSTAINSSVLNVGVLATVPLGTFGTVIFRGSTVACSLQGISLAFYPNQASVRCYLAPSLGTPFTLDSASNGVLDTNRLGYP